MHLPTRCGVTCSSFWPTSRPPPVLEHSGFDLDDQHARDAFARMGLGRRNEILPALADVAVLADHV